MLASRLPVHTLHYAQSTETTQGALQSDQYVFSDTPEPAVFPAPPQPLTRPLADSPPLVTAHFLHAVRTKLVHSICSQSSNLRPFKDGFLIRHSIYCQLQIHLTPTHLLVHPVLIPTPFQPIPPHLKPGVPITLLPYTTPAYFISNYTGPTSAIANQFKAQGVDCSPQFIIAWIAVENKQGEDKGILIIYPTDLCLCSSLYRPPLDYIPELPPQLQQSSPLSPSLSRAPIISSPTSESIQAFRALTVNQSKPLRYVATEVGGYVDAVARDRERERERLKRERESASASASASSPKILTRPVSTSSAPPPPNPPPPPPAPPPVSAQNFYPSPPQLPPPPHEARTSPVIESHPSPLPPPPPQSATSNVSYDPWPSSSDNYLDMDMDFEIGMSFVPNPTSETIPTQANNGFDDAFTDDDFSFFDRPNTTRPPPMATPALSPPHFGGEISQATWTPSAFVDAFTTPRSIEDPPELVPSSPSPESPCFVPATPNVHVDNESMGPNSFEPIPFSDYHRRADGKYAVGKFALPSPPVEDGWKARYNAATDPRIGVVKKLIGVKRKPPFEHEPRPPPVSDWDVKEEEIPSELDEEEEEEEEDEEDLDSPMLSRPATPPPSYLPLGPTLLQTRFQHSQLLPLSIPLRPPGSAVAPVGLSTTNAILASVPTPVSPAAMVGATSERSRSLEAAGFAIAAEVVENPVWAESWRTATVGVKSGVRVWNADVKLVAKALESVKGCLGLGNGVEMETPVKIEELFGLDVGNGFKPLEDPLISIGKNDTALDIKPTSLRFWEKLGLTPKSGPKDFTGFVLFEDDTGQKQPYVERWLTGVKNVYHGKNFGTMTIGKCTTTEDGLIPLRYDATLRKSLTNFITSLQPPQPTIVVFLVIPITIMSLSSPVLRQTLSIAKRVLGMYTGSSQIVFQLIPDSHIFYSLEASCSPPYDSPLDRIASSTYNKILLPITRDRARVLYPQINEHARKLLMGPSFTLARPAQLKVSYVRAAHASLDVLDRHTLLHVGYHVTACGKWMVACCVDQRGDAYNLRVNLTSAEGSELAEEEYVDVVKKVWDFGMEFAKKASLEWRVIFARLGVMGEKEKNAWSTVFKENVSSTRGQPPLHHYLICVVPDTPWMFVPSLEAKHPLLAPSSSRPTTSSSSSSSSNRSPTSTKPPSQPTIFTDISSTTYAIYPKNTIPISVPPSLDDLGLSQTFIPEDPVLSDPDAQSSSSSSTLPHPLTLLPQATSILIRVPHHASSSSTTMTHIHLLHTAHSASYTQQFAQTALSEAARVPSDQQTLQDVTENYFELAVLAKEKWRLDGVGGHEGLPFHVAAVDAMRMALVNTWDSGGGGDL